jgi:hypothetical protein
MATSTEPLIVYDKRELASFAKVIRNMSDIAVEETKRRVGELAQKELNEIRRVASSRGKVADRVAQGGKVKKSSLLGEISFGFASQRFSGGATTQFNTRNDPKGNRKGIGAGAEFGSGKYPQFPRWSGGMSKGAGSRGWFIYPTIRHLQPTIIKEFEEIILDIKKEFSDGK